MNRKHVKIRNTGILFELLVRRIAADVLNGNSDSFAIKLVREYFHPKSELGKELQLYRVFFNTPVLTEGKAFNMIDVLLKQRAKLNEKLLATQKFTLIKEIKANCDLKQFMMGRIPSYKVYASIYQLFENAEMEISDVEEVIKCKFLVVEHLKGNIKEEHIIKENSYVDTLRNQDKEIRYLSYKLLLEKFNDKYSNFNEKQKVLLREYINKGANDEQFKQFIVGETKQLLQQLQKNLKNVKNDVTRIKLVEVITQLQNMQTKVTIKENHITALLIAHQIVDEIQLLS